MFETYRTSAIEMNGSPPVGCPQRTATRDMNELVNELGGRGRGASYRLLNKRAIGGKMIRTGSANFHDPFNAPEIRQLRHEYANRAKSFSPDRITA